MATVVQGHLGVRRDGAPIDQGRDVEEAEEEGEDSGGDGGHSIRFW